MLQPKISSHFNGVFAEVFPTSRQLTSDLDANDLIAVCRENLTQKLLVHPGVFVDEIYNPKSAEATSFLQKFDMYSIKAAILVPSGTDRSKYEDMLSVTNMGTQFRFFEDESSARIWLTLD